MPLALDPNETFEVVLRSDQARPPGERPTLRFRHLTRRTSRRLGALLRRPREDFDRLPDAEARAAVDAWHDEIWTMLDSQLAGWERMATPGGQPIPFASFAVTPAGGLEIVLAESEMWEVAFALLRGGSLTVDEKKGSASPSPSRSEGSVGAAAAPSA
jgi:hypothetical protein